MNATNWHSKLLKKKLTELKALAQEFAVEGRFLAQKHLKMTWADAIMVRVIEMRDKAVLPLVEGKTVTEAMRTVLPRNITTGTSYHTVFRRTKYSRRDLKFDLDRKLLSVEPSEFDDEQELRKMVVHDPSDSKDRFVITDVTSMRIDEGNQLGTSTQMYHIIRFA